MSKLRHLRLILVPNMEIRVFELAPEHEPEVVLLLGGAPVDARRVQVARHLIHLIAGS